MLARAFERDECVARAHFARVDRKAVHDDVARYACIRVAGDERGKVHRTGFHGGTPSA